MARRRKKNIVVSRPFFLNFDSKNRHKSQAVYNLRWKAHRRYDRVENSREEKKKKKKKEMKEEEEEEKKWMNVRQVLANLCQVIAQSNDQVHQFFIHALLDEIISIKLEFVDENK